MGETTTTPNEAGAQARQMEAGALDQKSAPDAAVMRARKAAEFICKYIVRREVDTSYAETSYQKMIERVRKLKNDRGNPVVPTVVAAELFVIQLYGNVGVHDQDDSEVGPSQAIGCLQSLAFIVEWFVGTYLDLESSAPKKVVAKNPTTDGLSLGTKGLFEEVEHYRAELAGIISDTATLLLAKNLAKLICSRIYYLETHRSATAMSLSSLREALETIAKDREAVFPGVIQGQVQVIASLAKKTTTAEASQPGPNDEDATLCKSSADNLVDWYLHEYLGIARWSTRVKRSFTVVIAVLVLVGMGFLSNWTSP